MELLFYHTPMAGTRLGTSFGMLEGTASGGVAFSPSVILVC